MESEFSEKRGLEQGREAQLEAAREELSGLRIDEERMRERVEQQSCAAADSTVRWQQASQDLRTVSQRLEELKHGACSERQDVVAIAQGADQLQLRLGDKELECTVQEAAMADLQAQEEVCRSRFLKTLNAMSHARELPGKLDETLATQEHQLERERERMGDASKQLDQASERRRQQGSQVAALRGELADNTARRETLQAALAERRRQFEAVRGQADNQRAEFSRLTARRDSLREMLAHRAFTTEAVQDIFDAIEKSPHADFRPLGILADFLEVEEGYEKLVEQFLGEELEYVVVGAWGEAGRGVQLVREEFEGRAAFVVQSGPDLATGGFGPEPEHGDAERLMDHVRLVPRKAEAPPGMLPKLRDGYLVEDAFTAQRLAAVHPERYFLLPDGTWYRGNTVQIGRKASSGPLVLKQQLRDLIPELQEAERGLGQLDLDIESAGDAVQRDSAELETVREIYGLDSKDTGPFGRRCLLARRLVEKGVRFVQIFSGGWDSHDYLERSHKARICSLDKPLTALIKDLKQRGLLDETLVVWLGEFGRSPDNRHRGGGIAIGRGHNAHAQVMFFAGGGVKAGHVIGATDEIGNTAVEVVHPIKDLHVTLLHLLGLDDSKLTYFHGGRFKQLSQTGGEVIHELIAG